jgi:hypothetical protein
LRTERQELAEPGRSSLSRQGTVSHSSAIVNRSSGLLAHTLSSVRAELESLGRGPSSGGTETDDGLTTSSTTSVRSSDNPENDSAASASAARHNNTRPKREGSSEAMSKFGSSGAGSEDWRQWLG